MVRYKSSCRPRWRISWSRSTRCGCVSGRSRPAEISGYSCNPSRRRRRPMPATGSVLAPASCLWLIPRRIPPNPSSDFSVPIALTGFHRARRVHHREAKRPAHSPRRRGGYAQVISMTSWLRGWPHVSHGGGRRRSVYRFPSDHESVALLMGRIARRRPWRAHLTGNFPPGAPRIPRSGPGPSSVSVDRRLPTVRCFGWT